MLQTQSVSKELLELLSFIMKSEVFSNYTLVGGTALALQIGHRISVDLDFFGNQEIDEVLFIEELEKYGSVKLLQKSKNILILIVNNIKIDFVNYKYPFLEPNIVTENIRIASKKDIVAMKLNAISGRGSKKDFIDLFFLLNDFSLDEMLKFYNEKYEEGSYFMVLKSLTYFEDADLQINPVMLKNIDWEEMKEKILLEFEKTLKNE